jgi:hypothetical protein
MHRYKIIYGGSTCRMPNQLIGKYKRIFPIAPDVRTVCIPTSDGDMLHLDWYTSNNCHELRINLKSGRGCSAFYKNPNNNIYYQTGYHFLWHPDILQTDGDILTVYTFDDVGSTEGVYDIHSYGVQSEEYCRQYGNCIATLVFHTTADGDYFELIGDFEVHPSTLYIQEFYLPDIDTTLYLNRCTLVNGNRESGITYNIDSGEPSIGIYVRAGEADVCTVQGYFGADSITPADGDLIYIYIGVDFYDIYTGQGATDENRQNRETLWRDCSESGIKPVILKYRDGFWHLYSTTTNIYSFELPQIEDIVTLWDNSDAGNRDDIIIALAFDSGLASTSFYYRKSEERFIMHSYVNEFTDLYPAPQIGDEIHVFRYPDDISSYDAYYQAGATLGKLVNSRDDRFHGLFADWLKTNYGKPIILQYTGSWRLKR